MGKHNCSFCNENQDDVLVLIACFENDSFICNNCINACNEIVFDHKVRTAVKKALEETKTCQES